MVSLPLPGTRKSVALYWSAWAWRPTTMGLVQGVTNLEDKRYKLKILLKFQDFIQDITFFLKGEKFLKQSKAKMSGRLKEYSSLKHSQSIWDPLDYLFFPNLPKTHTQDRQCEPIFYVAFLWDLLAFISSVRISFLRVFEKANYFTREKGELKMNQETSTPLLNGSKI